jgi:hypothetical protein
MSRTALLLVLFVCASLILSGCAGWHPYDESQVPIITVGPGLQPVISWTPSEAYELHVYEGTEDGDGFGVLWTAKMGGGYENSLLSPVTYGVAPEGADLAPAPPLEEGKGYTITVTRKDPKGEGEGFSNTRHRYVGKLTFVASQE